VEGSIGHVCGRTFTGRQLMKLMNRLSQVGGCDITDTSDRADGIGTDTAAEVANDVCIGFDIGPSAVAETEEVAIWHRSREGLHQTVYGLNLRGAKLTNARQAANTTVFTIVH
jgi:hypothetical protein